MKPQEEKFTPFSTGTGAMIWYSNNCDLCKKAYFPKDGEYPSDKTMKEYCRIGKECKLKYHIDFGFITGEIPLEIAEQIGISETGGLKESCMFFSDNDNDGFTPPKRPKPEDPNQLVMPFIIDDIKNNCVASPDLFTGTELEVAQKTI